MYIILVNCRVFFTHVESRQRSKRSLLPQIPTCLFQIVFKIFYKTHFLWQSGPLTLWVRTWTVKWSKCKKRVFLRTVRRLYLQRASLLFIPKWKHIKPWEPHLCQGQRRPSAWYCQTEATYWLSLNLPGGFKCPTWWCYLFRATCFSLERLHSRRSSAQPATIMIKNSN
jgi:hypothetical protein